MSEAELPRVTASAGLPGVPVALPSTTPRAPVAERRVKYFGKELPPKCALRECWLSDDGEHYYCTDFTCNRHKYRRTKHDRYSRYAHRNPNPRAGSATPSPEAGKATGMGPLLYFHCPKCASGDIQMRLLQNRYECAACQFVWR